MVRRLVATLTTIVLLPCASATAQVATSQSRTTHLAKECEKAAKIVEKGKPDKKELGAWEFLWRCGSAAGPAAAAGIRAMRTETEFEVLSRTMPMIWYFLDPEVLQAQLDVANDRSATPLARVFAVRGLGSFVTSPELVVDFDELMTLADDCGLGRMTHGQVRQGGSLPSDYEARVIAALERLAWDASAPSSVRSAAKCMTQASRLR
jgi:hypothetical protein